MSCVILERTLLNTYWRCAWPNRLGQLWRSRKVMLYKQNRIKTFAHKMRTDLIFGLWCRKKFRNFGINTFSGLSGKLLSSTSALSSQIFCRAPNAPCNKTTCVIKNTGSIVSPNQSILLTKSRGIFSWYVLSSDSELFPVSVVIMFISIHQEYTVPLQQELWLSLFEMSWKIIPKLEVGEGNELVIPKPEVGFNCLSHQSWVCIGRLLTRS